MQYTNFLDLLRYLKINLKLSYPVQVRRVKLRKDLDGDCKLKNGKFFIRVKKDLFENQAIETIIHEFSHCLNWNKNLNKDEIHDDDWGKAYSVVYRKFLEWNEKNQ